MTDPQIRIAISVPSGDMVHADFAMCLARMCTTTHGMLVNVINNKSSIVAIARNNGVQLAQEFGAHYLLFLDSDMMFPENTLWRLLMHRQDIVAATYTKRVPPYPTLGTVLSGDVGPATPGLVEMARVPTGCLLIKMPVFDRLPRPYFRFEANEQTGDIIGEDYIFCDRARAAGFRIWCDPVLSHDIGHIGQQVFKIPLLPEQAGPR
jgi:glycosyltransferase involved in cell wall biosynthesis